MKQPIGFQIACVRHAANERPEGDTKRIGLEAAQETLEFIRDNEHVIKAAYRLLKRAEVIAFFKTFPDSEFMELPDASGAKGTSAAKETDCSEGASGHRTRI